jgi:hypothetical protein
MAQLYAHSIRSASSYVFQPDPPTLAIGRVQQSQIGERTMGTALAHMLRADAHTTADGPDDNGTAGPVASRSTAWPAEDRAEPVRDQAASQPTSGSGPPARTRTVSKEVHGTADRTRRPAVRRSARRA